MSRICDRRPCSGLTNMLPFLSFRMMGEENEDLRVIILTVKPVSNSPEDVRAQPLVLHYCPFCGMRLEEDVIEFMQRTGVA